MRAPRDPTRGAGHAGIAAAWVVALMSCLAWAGPAHAAPELLPDLVGEPPTNPQPLEVTRLADGRDHMLLRFDGAIHNIGPGALEIRGSQPIGGALTLTWQRIFRSDSSFRDDTSRHPQVRFENSDGHQHWHLQGAARYSLWNEAGTAQVAPASKVGFCLLDSERVDSFAAPRTYTVATTNYCGEGDQSPTQVFEGISAGWLDFYSADLPFQWVDVSDVPPGRYRLGADVDPDDFVVERDERNNGPAVSPTVVTVPGYVALPVATAGAGALTVALPAQPYGSPGPALLAIESPPAQGTLSAPAGAPLGAPQVVYTPRPGFAGRDTFTYSARDSASRFPIHSSVAAVTVTVPPAAATAATRPRLLTHLRFSRRGRVLRVRARAARSGVLRIVIRKGRRRLGSCRRHVRAGHRVTCPIRLRRHASLRRARAVVRLIVRGRTRAVDTYRVPRRLRS